MINSVVLVGRMTADPEARYTQAGDCVVEFTLAVDRPFTFGDNKKTDFFRVVAWKKTAEFVSQYCKKGRLLAVDGILIQNQWTDESGSRKSNIKVQADQVKALDRAKDGEGGEGGGEPNNGPDQSIDGSYQSPDVDDDLPF